jgi:hypothetical protein
LGLCALDQRLIGQIGLVVVERRCRQHERENDEIEESRDQACWLRATSDQESLQCPANGPLGQEPIQSLAGVSPMIRPSCNWGPLLIKMAKYKGGPRGQWKASVLLSLSKTSTQTRPQHTLQLHGTDSINYDSLLHPSPLPPGTDPHLRGLRSRRRQNCGWRHCACGTYTLVAWPSLCDSTTSDHKWRC